MALVIVLSLFSKSIFTRYFEINSIRRTLKSIANIFSDLSYSSFLLAFTRYSGENLISQSQIRQGDLLTTTVDRDRVNEADRQINAAQQEIQTKQTTRRQIMEQKRAIEITQQELLT